VRPGDTQPFSDILDNRGPAPLHPRRPRAIFQSQRVPSSEDRIAWQIIKFMYMVRGHLEDMTSPMHLRVGDDPDSLWTIGHRERESLCAVEGIGDPESTRKHDATILAHAGHDIALADQAVDV
jgi:hypothetical protein